MNPFTLKPEHLADDVLVITETLVGGRQFLVDKDLVVNGRQFEDAQTAAANFPDLNVETRSDTGDEGVELFWSDEYVEDRYALKQTPWRYCDPAGDVRLFQAADGRTAFFLQSHLDLFFGVGVEDVTLYALTAGEVYADTPEGRPRLLISPSSTKPVAPGEPPVNELPSLG